jgi:hypothetical protein
MKLAPRGWVLISLALSGSLLGCSSGDDDAAASSAGDDCKTGCVATIAAHCSNGPTTQADCEQTCQALDTGSCAAEYKALQACAQGKPISCSAQGLPSVAACSTEQNAFVACVS